MRHSVAKDIVIWQGGCKTVVMQTKMRWTENETLDEFRNEIVDKYDKWPIRSLGRGHYSLCSSACLRKHKFKSA